MRQPRRTAQRRPSPTGSRDGSSSWLSRTVRSSSRTRSTSMRLGRRVDRAALREDALEADQTARSQQAQRFSEIVQRLHPVAVAEHEVVPAVGQSRKDVQRPARDEPGPVPREARLAERLLGELLTVRLGVHRGQYAVGPHALQQIDPGDTRPRTDFGHRFRVSRGSQQSQRGTRAW